MKKLFCLFVLVALFSCEKKEVKYCYDCVDQTKAVTPECLREFNGDSYVNASGKTCLFVGKEDM